MGQISSSLLHIFRFLGTKREKAVATPLSAKFQFNILLVTKMRVSNP